LFITYAFQTFRHLIETQVLSSSTAAAKNPARYAIGVAQKDGIHLNPLTGIVFLKPSYDYLDASSKKKEPEGKDGQQPFYYIFLALTIIYCTF